MELAAGLGTLPTCAVEIILLIVAQKLISLSKIKLMSCSETAKIVNEIDEIDILSSD